MANVADIPEAVRAHVDAVIRANPRRLVRVVDYLLVINDCRDDRIPAGSAGPIELPRGISIEQLGGELTERLLDASELRGENWPPPARQFSVKFAYVRTVWSEGDEAELGNPYAWDADGCLYPCAQLSRLVRDNGVSTEHAVRRLVRADGTEQLVPFGGFETHVAYRLRPDTAGWLSIAEADELRVLLTELWDGLALPPRVARALRRVDSITRERYLEDALPLVVAGLESLLKVGRKYARAQFAQRASQLAAEIGIDVSAGRCGSLYDDRSALVHGADVDLSIPHRMTDLEQGFVSLVEILRRTVRRAMEDRAFAGVFSDDALIRTRWMVAVTDRQGRERHL